MSYLFILPTPDKDRLLRYENAFCNIANVRQIFSPRRLTNAPHTSLRISHIWDIRYTQSGPPVRRGSGSDSPLNRGVGTSPWRAINFVHAEIFVRTFSKACYIPASHRRRRTVINRTQIILFTQIISFIIKVHR